MHTLRLFQDLKSVQESPRISPGDQARVLNVSDGSDSIIVLAVLCLIMFTIFVVIFGIKFRKAWSEGAHGGKLIRESLRII